MIVSWAVISPASYPQLKPTITNCYPNSNSQNSRLGYIETQVISWPQGQLLLFQVSLLFLYIQLTQRGLVIPGRVLKIPAGLRQGNARSRQKSKSELQPRSAKQTRALLVVHLPRVAAVLRHQLQVLDADRLVLQLRHGVVHALLPRRDIVLLAGGRGRQLVPGTPRPPA